MPSEDFSTAEGVGLLCSKHLPLQCGQLTNSKRCLCFSKCQAQFTKGSELFLSWATGLQAKPSQVCSSTWATDCLQQVITTNREVLRRSRSGALNQPPHPPKASICVLFVTLLKDSSRCLSLTSHFNTYAPQYPKITRNPGTTDNYRGFASGSGTAADQLLSELNHTQPWCFHIFNENLSDLELQPCLPQHFTMGVVHRLQQNQFCAQSSAYSCITTLPDRGLQGIGVHTVLT